MEGYIPITFDDLGDEKTHSVNLNILECLDFKNTINVPCKI